MRRTAGVVVLGILLGLLQSGSAGPAAAAPALPSGFRLVDTPTGQPAYALTNLAWLDNGGLLTSGKAGTVTFVPAGGTPRTLATVPHVRAIGDHGLLGLALGNDYATSGRVYLAYDKGDPDGTGFGMVEEWRATPPAGPTSFTRTRTVLDGSRTSPQLLQKTRNHAIGSVVVAPDDTLFVSVGDDATNNGDPATLRAQDVGQPYGKLLRLTPEGRGVPGNPYYSSSAPSSWRSLVYASGFRNPFRFSLDPRSGIPHLGDVGWNTAEEVNTLRPGSNAGWPCWEGTQRTTFASYDVCVDLYAAGTAQPPVHTYLKNGVQASVVGGIHYSGTSYPAAYRGAWFFGDYSRQTLWSLATDTAGRLTRAPESDGFATDAGGPVAFATGPNGDVTYADILSGTARRLVHTAGNRAPVARFTTSTDASTRTVTFSAADSYDLDGDALTYRWSLGDGSTATGRNVVHTYGSADPVPVTLTVRDALGATGSTTTTVHPANSVPRLTLQTPGQRLFAVGDRIELSATAADAEDGTLGVAWDTALLHCPSAGSCHRHPEEASTGTSYSRTFTDHGADTTVLVTARVADRQGATATASYEARPRLRTLAVTSPVAVAVDGIPAASAQVVAGARVQLAAPLSSSYWRFRSWSDGGAATHGITMPDADLTLSARYRTAIAVKYAQLGGAESSLGSPTSLEYDIAGGRARNYDGGRLYWSSGTGAHEVHGGILAKYLRGGGPRTYGFPTADERAVTGGRSSVFTGARFYWGPDSGTHWSRGPLLAKYLAAGGPDRYGLPTTDDTSVTGGYSIAFTGGRSIFWSRATGAHLVYGAIRNRYAASGHQDSCLGFPTTDEYAVTDGRRNRFEGGSITYRLSTRRTTVVC